MKGTDGEKTKPELVVEAPSDENNGGNMGGGVSKETEGGGVGQEAQDAFDESAESGRRNSAKTEKSGLRR